MVKLIAVGIVLGLLLAVSLRAEDAEQKGQFVTLSAQDQLVFDRLLQALRNIETEIEKLRLRGCIGKVQSAEACGQFDQQGRITIVKTKEK